MRSRHRHQPGHRPAQRKAPARLWPVLVVLLVGLGGVAGCSASDRSSAADATSEPTSRSPPPSQPNSASNAAPAPPTTSTGPELPGGGRRVLPDHRLVGFSGAPGAPTLGRLTGDLTAAAAALQQQASAYAGDRPVLPVFELIATTAHPTPGPDGTYRSRSSDSTIGAYLEAARAAGGVLLLNIQPGRADFLQEVRAYEPWLREPDVGVALDPEWAVGPGAVPGQSYGTTTGTELNAVADYLTGLVRSGNLPQKVMVYHQVAASVVTDEAALLPRSELAIVKSVDGIGSPTMKIDTWNVLTRTTPAGVAAGVKLFYAEDTEFGPLMTPAEVLALQPVPQYVLYE